MRIVMENKSAAPALDRGLSIIEYIANNGSAVSLKQIAGDLVIPPASAFRLLKNLTSRGYVQEINNGQLFYVLGTKILSLADTYNRNTPLQAIAKTFIITLAQKSEQTVQLAIIGDQGKLIYVDQAFSSAPLCIVAPLYQPIDLNVSASGKILFSYLSEDTQRSILENLTFKSAAPNTITEKSVFLKEATKSRIQGYAIDNEEFSPGIGCIAVPIFDHNSNCVAALGITGTIQNYRNQSKFQNLLCALQTTALDISLKLGFHLL